MIWKIGFRDRWLYVYILLEFQSTVDRCMGVRLLTYIGLRIPDKDFSTYEDLLEVDTMLAEKVRDWTRAWEKEGLRKGIHRGRREGLERGLQKGIKQGKQEGKEKGLIQTAIRMLEKDMELAVIVDITGLPLEKIKDISDNREKYAAELEN